MRSSHTAILGCIAVLLFSTLALLTLPACDGHATSGAAMRCPGLQANPGSTYPDKMAVRHGYVHAIIWLVPRSFVQQRGMGRPLLNKVFNNSDIYVYGAPPSPVGLPTAAYGSYTKIRAAFVAGTLPGRYRAVIYDNERWAHTPVTEQRHPIYYERLVAGLLHQHGLIYIATPAPDLMWATGRPRDSYATYIADDMVGHTARYADILDIQGQVRETNLREFVSFVRTAVRQSRAANPHIKVIIGLRTNPGGQELFDAYRAVAGLADGYWLNVNGRPQVAMYLLCRIYGSPHWPA